LDNDSDSEGNKGFCHHCATTDKWKERIRDGSFIFSHPNQQLLKMLSDNIKQFSLADINNQKEEEKRKSVAINQEKKKQNKKEMERLRDEARTF